MSLPDDGTLVYAGIGSRKTPDATLDDMTTMSAWLTLPSELRTANCTGRRSARKPRKNTRASLSSAPPSSHISPKPTYVRVSPSSARMA